MLSIKEVEYEGEIKDSVKKGFLDHSVSQIGFDEFCEEKFFAVFDKDEFAGLIAIKQVLGALWLKTLYVEVRYRNQGIGTKLIEYISNFAKENQLKFIFVETFSFQALEFYKKLGFVLEFTREGYKSRVKFHYLRRDL